MQIKGVEIDDTFAEAFEMYGTRFRITAANDKWALIAAREATGFATSIIECGCEGGIERKVSKTETLDGRPGYDVIFLTMDKKSLQKQLVKRVGQSIMTSVTSACFNALDADESIKIGGNLRYFGDGYQISKLYGDRRFWRIPVMEGEFIIEESFGITNGIGGGNIIILAEDINSALSAAESAVEAMKKIKGVILPFPGGVVRSGSKTDSKYSFLNASTNIHYCPTIKSQVKSSLCEKTGCVLEIVIDGLNIESINKAMREGILAACRPGVLKITAGNYGGKLGSYNINLHQILRGEES